MKTPKTLKEPKPKSLNSWEINTEECVSDRVVLALSRAYKYKGNDVHKACDVLEKHGWQLIPW